MGKMKEMQIDIIESLIKFIRLGKLIMFDKQGNTLEESNYTDNQLFDLISSDNFLFQQPTIN